MKKVFYKPIIIIFIIIFVIIILVCSLTTQIKLDYSENVYSIEVHVPGVRSIRTKDKDIINESINRLNKIRYLKYSIFKYYNASPDGTITLYDKNNKVLETIDLYGYIAVYGDKRYTVLPFTYVKLENLCREFNKKQ